MRLSEPRDCIGMRGASVLEVALALAVLALLCLGATLAVPAAVDNTRDRQVEDQLVRLKEAIVGKPREVQRGERNLSRFGYVGDMGNLPPSLTDLVEAGAQPDYAVDLITQLGHGWRGPYLSTSPVDPLVDPWGNAFLYNTTPGTSAVTGAPIVATLRSMGPDGTTDTADDAFIEIHRGEAFSRMIGYVQRNGNVIPGVDVTLSYPMNGAVAASTTSTDAQGRYEFPDVPHGDRVIETEPGLAYRADSGFALTNDGEDVEFIVENLGKNQTTAGSFTLTYASDPPAYYRRVRINDDEVYDDNTPRKGSGDTVTFSSEVVAGTGVTQEPSHALVTSEVFHVPAINLTTVGSGGALHIELENFDDVASGNGGAVDMTGVTFQVEFSDGSMTVFTAKTEP